MRAIKQIIDTIRKVTRYEQTVEADRTSVINMLLILALDIFLINIENIRLQRWTVVALVYSICGICLITAFLIKRIRNVGRLARVAAILLAFFAAPAAYLGLNDGFFMLWFFLFPFLTLINIGLSFGAPMCIVYGLIITAMFWTPLSGFLGYDYGRDYLFYYPVFYWGLCLLVVTMDIFYKYYQIQQLENETRLEQEVANTVRDIQQLMVNSVTAISHMIDDKDAYTSQHSRRVAYYSRLIAQHLPGEDISDEDLELIYRSGLLHDIGKIAVPDRVLNKPAALNDEEYQLMKQHTIWGEEILKDMEFLPQADCGAIYHHEKYAGNGYPTGNPSRDLPLMVRIISVADALDAMNSDRCYRRHCSAEYICRQLTEGAGTQFDPAIAQKTVELIQSGIISVPLQEAQV